MGGGLGGVGDCSLRSGGGRCTSGMVAVGSVAGSVLAR